MPDRSTAWRRVAGPAAIVLVALALRIVAIAVDTGYKPANDAFEYDFYARSIAAGHGYPESGYLLQGGPTAIRGPGYPFLLGAVYAISGNSVTAGRLLNALLGALVVLLLYLIAKRVWGRRIGIATAALAAVFPPLVLAARDLVSEPLFIAVALGAVLCVLEFRRSGGMLRWAAAAGILCGLAALTRPTGFVLMVPVLVGVWTLRPRLAMESLRAPTLALLCTVVVLVPWTIRDALEFGRFVPITTSGGIAAAGTYNEASYRDSESHGAWRDPQIVPTFTPLFTTPGIDEGTVDVVLRRDARRFAWENPGYVASTTAWNLLRLFEIVGGSVVDRHGNPVSDRGIGSADPAIERVSLCLAGILVAIGLWAIVGSGSRRRHAPPRVPRGPLFLWLVPILLIAAAAPIAGLPRYRLPADPFLLILAAIGLLTLWEWPRSPLQAMASK